MSLSNAVSIAFLLILTSSLIATLATYMYVDFLSKKDLINQLILPKKLKSPKFWNQILTHEH